MFHIFECFIGRLYTFPPISYRTCCDTITDVFLYLHNHCYLICIAWFIFRLFTVRITSFKTQISSFKALITNVSKINQTMMLFVLQYLLKVELGHKNTCLSANPTDPNFKCLP